MDQTLLIQFLTAATSFSCGALLVWWIHRRGSSLTPDPRPHLEAPAAAATIVMPEEVKNQLLNETKRDYEQALNKSAAGFSHDLSTTSDKINTQIKDLSANVIANELEEYRQGLAHLREDALAGMSSVQEALAKQRQELEAQLEQEIQTEKQRRLEQLDAKLGEAVSAFLVEVLQHNVDLGAQSPYLLDMLEEHKDELKEEVSHDV